MHKSKRLGRMLLSLLVVGALGAVSAASAMATPHWSDGTHGIRVSGSLTVEKSGLTTKTCTASALQSSLGSTEWMWPYTTGVENPKANLIYSCPNGARPNTKLELFMMLKPLSTTSVNMGSGSEKPEQIQPWELSYTQNASTVGAFKNGSGTTPSTLTFAKTLIGGGIYISGTLTVTTSTGGLLTILP